MRRNKVLVVLLGLLCLFGMSSTVFGSSLQWSKQQMRVNGQKVECQAFNYQGYNFYRLRFIAELLNGTEKQFALDYEAATNKMLIQTGEAYDREPSLYEKPELGQAHMVESQQKLIVDGKEVSVEAYNLGGYNFFKLRDLGMAIEFDVAYEAATDTVVIDTDKDPATKEPIAFRSAVGPCEEGYQAMIDAYHRHGEARVKPPAYFDTGVRKPVEGYYGPLFLSKQDLEANKDVLDFHLEASSINNPTLKKLFDFPHFVFSDNCMGSFTIAKSAQMSVREYYDLLQVEFVGANEKPYYQGIGEDGKLYTFSQKGQVWLPMDIELCYRLEEYEGGDYPNTMPQNAGFAMAKGTADKPLSTAKFPGPCQLTLGLKVKDDDTMIYRPMILLVLE